MTCSGDQNVDVSVQNSVNQERLIFGVNSPVPYCGYGFVNPGTLVGRVLHYSFLPVVWLCSS